MKYYKYIIFGLSIVLMILGFIFNNCFIKLILEIVGILLLSILLSKKRIKFLLLYILIIFLCLFISDYLLVKNFKRIPVFSYNIKSNEKINIYNSIGYRVFDCDGLRIVDEFYNKPYICSNNLAISYDSNAFINQIVDNYNKFHNKFVKIKGKISGLEGVDNLEMKAYESNIVTVNGYVKFADNIVLNFLFNSKDSNLGNYQVYDNITVIGRVSKIVHKNNIYYVTFKDSKIVKDDLYNDFTISVTSEKQCSNDSTMNLILKDDVYDIYSSCMDSIVVKYSDNVIYELGFLLTSHKINIKDVLSKTNDIETIKDNSIYKYDGFNIVSCKDSNNRIKYLIGSSKLNLEDNICSKEDIK